MNTPDCLLDCGCWQRIRLDQARIGLVAMCVFHGEGTIMAVNYYEWHIRCQSVGCRFGRWMGQSEALARSVNGNHATARNHLGGVSYDRITWDGKGTIYRKEVDRRDRIRIPPAPTLRYRNVTRKIEDWPSPPF